eukprot:TRINITY_DN87581_c0_g1_i1.p1 TRINITY_DN87581_c0_g1~~TRINITY_DN87581_c0_g1_i1.p1  ORF type:complete len:1809 (-),score=406.61 TRINITY_DN87581_c0_g1_i1:116-5542(-)
MQEGCEDADATATAEDRTVDIIGVPGDATEADLLDFLNAALLATAGVEVDEEEVLSNGPCISCRCYDQRAQITCRNSYAASVTVCLDSIEFMGCQLHLKRPSNYSPPADGDPAAELMEHLDALDLKALLGEAASSTGEEATESQSKEAATMQSQDVHEPTSAPRKTAAPWHECSWRGKWEKVVPRSNPQRLHQSYYQLLGISRSAFPSEIRGAYRSRCRQAATIAKSTGLTGHSPTMISNLTRWQEAYKTLSNPSKRQAYDHSWLLFMEDAWNASKHKDMRLGAFLLRHFQSMPLPNMQGCIHRVPIDRRHADIFKQESKLLKSKTRGAEILVLPKKLAAAVNPASESPCEVWLAGNPEQVAKAKEVLKQVAEEADGLKVPPDGVVLLIPPTAKSAQFEAPNKDIIFSQIKAQTQATVTICELRLVVRGGPQVPLAVAMLQKYINWNGTILSFHGSQMDPWCYASLAERSAGVPNGNLVPQREPQLHEVWSVLRNVPLKTQSKCMVQTCQKILHELSAGQVLLGVALLRCLLSSIVYQEVVSRSATEQAPFICAVMKLWTKKSDLLTGSCFSRHSLLQVLLQIPYFFLQTPLGLQMRWQGLGLLRQIVGTRAAWVPWTSLMTPQVATFMNSLFGLVSPGVAWTAEWTNNQSVVAFILEYCVVQEFFVDAQHGVHLKPQVQAPQSMEATAPVPAPAQATAAAAVAKAAAATAEASSAAAAAAAAAAPTAAQQQSAQAASSAATAPAPAAAKQNEAVSPPPPPSAANSEERAPPPAPPKPRRGGLRRSSRARRSQSRTTDSSSSPGRSRSVQTRSEQVCEEDLKQLRSASDVRLVSAQQAARYLKLAAQLCRDDPNNRRPSIEAQLLSQATNKAHGSAEELRKLLGLPATELLRVIAGLEQVKAPGQAQAVSWSRSSLLLLLHAATLELREASSSQAGKKELEFLSTAMKPPFNTQLNLEECRVVPELARNTRSPKTQLQLAKLLAKERLPAAHCAKVRTSLQRAAQATEGKHWKDRVEDLVHFARALSICAKDCKNQASNDGDAASCQRSLCEGLQKLTSIFLKQHDVSLEQLGNFAQYLADADVTNKELAHRIGEAAERHAHLGSEWKAAEFWQLLQSVDALGLPDALDDVLRTLESWGSLRRLAKQAPPSAIVLLIAAAARLDTPLLVSSFCTDSLPDQLSLGELAAVITAWPSGEASAWASLLPFRRLVLERAVSKASDAEYGSLSPLQADALVRAASEDRHLLLRLRTSPALLVAVQPKPLKSIVYLVEVFMSCQIYVPYAGCVCTAQLLRILAAGTDMGDALLDSRNAVRSLNRSGVLAELPGATAALAGLPRLRTIAASERCNDLVLAELLGALMNPLTRPQSADAATEKDIMAEEEELVTYVRQLEALAGVDDAREAESWTLEELRALVEKKSRGREEVFRLSAVQHALGTLWLEALLVRSGRLLWTGEKRVFRRPAEPQKATLALAEVLAGVSPAHRGKMPASWPPSLMVRCVGRGADEDSTCLAGLYRAMREPYHGCRSYELCAPPKSADRLPVLLYCYQEDNGQRQWWFGPKLGGEQVWASAPASTTNPGLPPRRGWQFLGDSQEGRVVIKVLTLESAQQLQAQQKQQQQAPDKTSEPAAVEKATAARPILLEAKPKAIASAAPDPRPFQGSDVTAAVTQALPDDSPPKTPPPASKTAASPGSAEATQEASSTDLKRPIHEVDAASSSKRPRVEEEDRRDKKCRDWLRSIDGGKGVLLEYFAALKEEFDADLMQVAAAKSPNEAGLKSIDPCFWSALGVTKLGHRMLFVKGFANLREFT